MERKGKSVPKKANSQQIGHKKQGLSCENEKRKSDEKFKILQYSSQNNLPGQF